jgi:hypothetical protein
MALTIDDLLNALQNPSKATLTNSKDTWKRIGQGDSFSELGLNSSELESFLKEWVENNPYSNI